MYSFYYLEPVCCSLSGSNCCFLTCTQVSQEVGQVVWFSHLFKNFPHFIVIHTVKGFGIVKKVEIDVYLKLSCFSDDPADAGNLISGSSAFSKTSLNIWKFMVHVLLKPGLENFNYNDSKLIVWSLNYFCTKLILSEVKVKWNLLSHIWLCDLMDYTVHGILQARMLEWVAFPFSRGSYQARDQTQVSRISGRFFTSWAKREALNSVPEAVVVMVVWLLSHFQLIATPWTIACQVPLSMGFSRQEYWSGLPFPSQGIFPTQESNLGLLNCMQILYQLNYERSPGKKKKKKSESCSVMSHYF